ncbi:MAG: hypothetical protein KJZ83_20815 [Burkholderiaceae bacterium]|nr:hypothetical protein [Burkholderiaceae bacterium]
MKKPRVTEETVENSIFRATTTRISITDDEALAAAFDRPGIFEVTEEIVAARLRYVRDLLGIDPEVDARGVAATLRAESVPLTEQYEAASVLEYGETLSTMLGRRTDPPTAVAYYAMQFEAAIFRLALLPIDKTVAIGRKRRKAQKQNASEPRGGILNAIAKKLAPRADETARDLWGELYSELDARHLRPVEILPDKVIAHDDRKGERTETEFETWRVTLSKERGKQKRAP